LETVRVNDLETVRVHEGLDFVWTALNLDKKVMIADLALIRLTPFPCKYVLSTMGASKESISKFLIGNRFHVKLPILSPENCKQSLRVKSWKAEVKAEKKQTQDHNQNFVTQAHKS